MKLWGLALMFLAPILAGVTVSGYVALEIGTPSVEGLLHQQDRSSAATHIYADDGSLLAQLSARKGKHLRLSEMPPHLIQAVVAAEDSRFFSHRGVDLIAILRAFAHNLHHGSIRQGGSTITQQLVKVTFLTPERTMRRKLREAHLARKLEKELSKESILELYLNKVYFGHGAYGVAMASEVYFNKPTSELTLSEAALLAGLIRSPLNYSPFLNEARAKKRQAEVLGRMAQEGYITSAQAQSALGETITLSSKQLFSDENRYFIDHVTQYLENTYSHEQIYQTGLEVYTTLSPDIQHEAQAALRKGLLALDKRGGWRGPLQHGAVGDEMPSDVETFQRELFPGTLAKAVVFDVGPDKAVLKVGGRRTGTLLKKDAAWARTIVEPDTGKVRYLRDFRLNKILKAGDVVLVRVIKIKGDTLSLALEQEPRAEGALVCAEPSTGYVRALVGGYDYARSQFNRAVYAWRQPGSAFKPILYATALEMGHTPASIINDTEITYVDEAGEEWTPRNYDEEFYGPTTLREALAYSRNGVSIQLLDEIGIDKVVQYARSLGIQGDLPRDLTLALGSLSVAPLDLVFAYVPFANGGSRVSPIFVKKIVGPGEQVLELHKPTSTRVLSSETAFLMTTMLQDAVHYGTAWKAKAIGREDLAAKTGSTNEYRDAWFIGYSPWLIAGVWVGNDDMSPLGENETGSRAAGPIWVEFMKAGLRGYPEMVYEPPEGIVGLYVDAETGFAVNSPAEELPDSIYFEYFQAGTEPQPDPDAETPLATNHETEEEPAYRIFN